MAMKLANPMDMTEQVAYHIWAAVATATKAFGNVRVKVDSRNCRIYLVVTLRWWAKAKRLSMLHDVWLRRAEDRVLNLVPNGWRSLIYYEQTNGSVAQSSRPSGTVGADDAVRQTRRDRGSRDGSKQTGKSGANKTDREVSG